MMAIGSRKVLAMRLQDVSHFTRPRLELEQYVTPPDVAASLLWEANLAGHIEGRVVADLGAGTGMLTIGALLLGAERVISVEMDEDAADDLERNLDSLGLDLERVELVRGDARKVTVKADTVVQNPPFGVWRRHADADFVQAAKRTGGVVYTLHKEATDAVTWMEAQAAPGHRLETLSRVVMTIPPVHAFHRKKLYMVAVLLFRLTPRG